MLFFSWAAGAALVGSYLFEMLKIVLVAELHVYSGLDFVIHKYWNHRISLIGRLWDKEYDAEHKNPEEYGADPVPSQSFVLRIDSQLDTMSQEATIEGRENFTHPNVHRYPSSSMI